ncbi:MAG: mannonate dehydratase [Actinomycetota bacterium]|jgi:mannonate dehydratase|nr:mannonate dehydratase [Actinomycetota bacterium]
MEVMVGQLQELDEETATFARQLGVEAVQLNTPALDATGGVWAYESLSQLKRRCEGFGLKLVALENVPQAWMHDIKLGGPRQREQLERYCETIANVGRAGVPYLGFNFLVNGVWRTDTEAPGRGGALVSAFDAALVGRGNVAAGPQGRTANGEVAIGEEELWENFETFLRSALPAAEAAGVRLALHPDDPPVRSLGTTACLFYSVGNMKRAYDLAGGSPAFGFDLCLGTVSEMEGGPAAVRAAIEAFGPLGAICYVHFRQVQGTVPSFKECFLGEGNYSPREVVDLLQASGFDGYLLDDHVPKMVGDTAWGHRARAHAIGYLQGLLSGTSTPVPERLDRPPARAVGSAVGLEGGV